jgi:hypothetical protein
MPPTPAWRTFRDSIARPPSSLCTLRAGVVADYATLASDWWLTFVASSSRTTGLISSCVASQRSRSSQFRCPLAPHLTTDFSRREKIRPLCAPTVACRDPGPDPDPLRTCGKLMKIRPLCRDPLDLPPMARPFANKPSSADRRRNHENGRANVKPEGELKAAREGNHG